SKMLASNGLRSCRGVARYRYSGNPDSGETMMRTPQASDRGRPRPQLCRRSFDREIKKSEVSWRKVWPTSSSSDVLSYSNGIGLRGIPKFNSSNHHSNASLTRRLRVMSELQVIESVIVRAARRTRCQRALNGLAWGLLVGALPLLLGLILYKLLPIPQWVIPALAGLAAGLTTVGLVRGVCRKPSLLETARWVDERM